MIYGSALLAGCGAVVVRIMIAAAAHNAVNGAPRINSVVIAIPARSTFVHTNT
jgi:hypothetical protein